jgi:hypothetical protein
LELLAGASADLSTNSTLQQPEQYNKRLCSGPTRLAGDWRLSGWAIQIEDRGDLAILTKNPRLKPSRLMGLIRGAEAPRSLQKGTGWVFHESEV